MSEPFPQEPIDPDVTARSETTMLAPPDPVVEGASATSSPERNSSGPAAYAIFGVAVALICAIGMGIAGGFGAFIERLIPEFEGVEYQVETLPNGEGLSISIPPTAEQDVIEPPDLGLDLDGLDYYDFPDDLDEWGLGFSDEDPVSLEEALARDYSFQSATLDGMVELPDNPSGDAAAVSAFAQALAEADKAYAEQANALFDEAKADPAQARAKLLEIKSICERAADEVEALPVPQDLSSADASSVKSLLRNAKHGIEGRWECLEDLVELLLDETGRRPSLLDTTDSFVTWAIEIAADEIQMALDTASTAS